MSKDNQHSTSDRGYVAGQIKSIDLGSLITAPVLAAAQGQEVLVNNYLKFITKLAFNEPTNTGSNLGGAIGGVLGNLIGVGAGIGESLGTAVGSVFNEGETTKVIKFKLDRPVKTQDGTIKNNSTLIQAPLLSLVPLPCFTMDKLTIDFTMEVEDQYETSTELTDESSKNETDTSNRERRWWNFWSSEKGGNTTTKITGKITSDIKTSRTTRNKSTLVIHAEAIQQPPSEGMAKLTDLFTAMIDPIDTTPRDSVAATE